MSDAISGVGLGAGVVYGRLIEASHDPKVSVNGPVILVHRALSATDILAARTDLDVVGHIVPPTGRLSHTAWAIHYLDSAGLSVNQNGLPIGEYCSLDADNGRLTVAGEAKLSTTATRPAPASAGPSGPIEVRAQLLAEDDLDIVLFDGACSGLGEVKAEAGGGLTAALIRRVLKETPWREFPIRFFDVTHDKGDASIFTPQGPLELRGVRILDRDPAIFERFVDLIPGDAMDLVICVLPMVVRAEEVEMVRELAGHHGLRVGSLVETPAAVLNIERIVDVSDVIMAGPSDLSQYTFALSRDLHDDRVFPSEGFAQEIVDQLVHVGSVCRASGVPYILPVDLPPSEMMVGQVRSISPTSIAVPPRRCVAWSEALRLNDGKINSVTSPF